MDMEARYREQVDATAQELRPLPDGELLRQWEDIAKHDADLACAVFDQHADLRARLSRPPRNERNRGATCVSYSRGDDGRWVLDRIEVRGRRNARRAKRQHPTSAVVVIAPLARPRQSRGRPHRRRGSRRASRSRGDPDDADAEPAGLASKPRRQLHGGEA